MARWLAGVVLIFIVLVFQVSNISNVHMHPDEELSYRATNGGLDNVFYYQQSMQDNQAPLWFISFWAWRQSIGDAETTSRFMGILITVLTLAMAYRLGRRWFGNAAALAAVAVLGAHHFLFTYSLDIRPYPLAIFTATLCMWMFERWRNTPTRSRTLAYALSVTLILYVHYLLLFLVIGQGIFLLLAQRLNRRLVLGGIGAMALAFVLWLPWFPTFVSQVVGLRNIELESGTARGVAGIGVSTLATSLPTITQLIGIATNGVPWLYAIVLVIGFVMLWRRSAYWLALTWAVSVPAIALGANLLAAVYAPRFVSHTSVGLALAVGAALLLRPTRLRLTLAAVFVGVNLLSFPSQFPPDRIPFRDLYTQVSSLAREGDVLLMRRGGEIDGFVEWQVEHYLPPFLQTSQVTTIEQAEASRRVWFLTGDLFHETVEQDFAQLEPTHPVQTAFGQCNRAWCYVAQLMEAPPWNAPQVFGDTVAFWGMDVDSVTANEIATRLWWRVEDPPPLDYSIGLHLLNADGVLVAQSDGPIQHYGTETVQTSTMQPGRIYIDWRRLILPSLPAGEYTLALVVYQSWDNVSLTLPTGEDRLILETITIP